LKFFGKIEESQIDPIVTMIEDSVRSIRPFPLRVRGAGAFPNLRNPRVIWVGLVDGEDVLLPLQKELEASFQKIGFQAEERPFQPHLTLGRMKSNRGKENLFPRIVKHQDDELGNFQVERLVLFKSDLRPSGPIYTALREVKLRDNLTAQSREPGAQS
jgi:2'-5' RNA ligase